MIAIMIALGLITQGCSSSAPVVLPSASVDVTELTEPHVLTAVYNPNDLSKFIYTSDATGPTETGQQISFGDFPKNAGITFTATIDNTVGATGKFAFVQNGKAKTTEIRDDGVAITPISADDQWYADDGGFTGMPYDQTTFNVNSNQKSLVFSTEDSPYYPLHHGSKNISIKQDYRMYLVWIPKNGELIQDGISLGKIEWGWSATLENRDSRPYFYDWTIVTKNQYRNGWKPGGEKPVYQPSLPLFQSY